jgi:hypothetical protein
MEFDRRLTTKVADDATLLAPAVAVAGLRFSVLQMDWCRRVCAGELVCGGAEAAPTVTLVTFPATVPAIARLLPEAMLGSALDFVSFLGEHSVGTFSEVPADTIGALLTCIVAFLKNPGYIHSPHLRATFGKVRLG